MTQDPIKHCGGHGPVATEPVRVDPAHRLHRVAEVACDGRERCALGEQLRRAEVTQSMEREPIGGEPGSTERRLPRQPIELLSAEKCRAMLTREEDTVALLVVAEVPA